MQLILFFKKTWQTTQIRDNELQVDIRYVLPYSIRDATREASRKRRDIYYCIWIIKTQDISQQRAQAVKDAACEEINIFQCECLTYIFAWRRWRLFLFLKITSSGILSRITCCSSTTGTMTLPKPKQPSSFRWFSQVATTLHSDVLERVKGKSILNV